jgi:hypothetical protein
MDFVDHVNLTALCAEIHGGGPTIRCLRQTAAPLASIVSFARRLVNQ